MLHAAFVVAASCCLLLPGARPVVANVHIEAPRGEGAAADKWAPLRFLLGTWEGTTNGQPGDGSVRRQYRLVLREHFIEVHNASTYPPQEKNAKGEAHEDIGYISYDRSRTAFVLRQFHVEGFVNSYVTGPNPTPPVVFTSEGIENIPSGWRARETYRVISDDEFVEVFELAEPGKEFTLYSETRLKRGK